MNTTKGTRGNATKEAFASLKMGDVVIVYDTETTGVTSSDYVVEFSYIQAIFDGKKLNTVKEGDFFIKPPVPMPKAASDVNHITDEMLADKPEECEAVEEIFKLFGNAPAVVAGHNILFDNRMIAAMYDRNGKGEFLPKLVIDTLPASKDLIPPAEIEAFFVATGREVTRNKKGFYKLENLSPMLGIVSDEDDENEFHSSIFDVRCTMGLINIFIERYKEITEVQETDDSIGIRPKILSVYTKRFSEKANFIFVKTDTGFFMYNKYFETWKAKEEIIKTNMDALIEEVMKYTGVANEGDLQYWTEKKRA